MTTQYTPTLKLALPVTGELSGTWGDVVNDNITSMIEQAIAGLSTINTWTANAHTLTTANGTTSESRCAMLVAATGGGAPTAAAEIICPAAAKLYVLQNNTSYAVTLKTSAGTGVAVAAGDTAFLFCDATNVNSCVTTIVNGNITGNLTVGGNATINGNTTLGNATSDTITATARFASDLVPSTDNARDLGSAANSWRSLWIDGTATMALVAIAGGTIDGVSIGSTTAATIINVDNLRLDGNTISSTDTNGNVVIAPNGTGDVQLDADTVRVGDSAAAATLTSNGAGALTVTTGGAANLTLSTNGGTTSGTVVIANGVNGNITLTPDGTGDVILSADRVQMGDSNTDTTLTTNGTGSLNLTTNDGTNSGTIQIAQGINGNITLTPNGTGSVSISKLYSSGNTTLGATSANTLSVAALVNSNLLFTDATYDIGATGANRPRDLFLSRNLTVGGTLTLTGGVNLNGNVTVGDTAADTLTINSTITSNLIFTDNTYDIGASGATRPRNLYLAGGATIGGNTAVTGTLSATGNITGSTSLLLPSTTAAIGFGVGATEQIYRIGNALRIYANSADIATFSSTGLAVTGTFSSTLGATIQGLTVGKGTNAISGNTVLGEGALRGANSGTGFNVAIGYQAGYNNTSGQQSIYIGQNAGYFVTTGSYNVAVGTVALQGAVGTSTGSHNVAMGTGALGGNTTASYNTALGSNALNANTTASNNTAVGYQAGYQNTGASNAFFGYQAGYANTAGAFNIFIGAYSASGVGASVITGSGNNVIGISAGASLTSGSYNTFVGPNGQVSQGAGGLITIGSKNTLLGAYNGNQGGLDIRTASNYIVLSDGDGNVRFVNNNSGVDSFLPGASPLYVASDTFASNLHIGNNVAIMSYGVAGNRQLQLASNLYYYNGGYRYKTSNGASKLSVGTLGGWDFSGAVAGAADAVAAMVSTLGTDGNGYTVYLQGGAISQTGTGITFPATQLASSNANTLDDYEEGDWTPVINGTTFTNAGWYVKIGRNVFLGFNNVTGVAAISNNASFDITGTPFAVKTDSGTGNYKFGGAVSININDESDSYKMAPMVGRIQNTTNFWNGKNISGAATTTADPFNMTGFFVSD